MLEILLVIAISKKIAAKLKEKGRNATGYVVLFIVFWFGGEIVGAVAGTIFTIAMNPNAINDGFNLTAYLFALGGAGVGALIAWSIASAVPPVVEPLRMDLDAYDALEKEDRRERRRRYVDDDGAFEDPDRR